MGEHDVEKVARLVSPYECEQLVYCEVDGMQDVACDLVFERREKPPRSVVSPLDFGGFAVSFHHRTDEARSFDGDVELKAVVG